MVNKKQPDIPEFVHLDYLAAVDAGCSFFETTFQTRQDFRWALCFDELELAPVWLQQLLFSQQRSSTERFLIKLSTSPIPITLGRTSAVPKHDLRLIRLWDYSGKRAEDFSERLTRSFLGRRFGFDVDPVVLFGESKIAEEADSYTSVDKYQEGSPEWHLLKEVAAWDKGLRKILSDAGISPSNPTTHDIRLRDSVLRKAKPLALLRREFLKETNEGSVVFRSRKVSSIYQGTKAIYKVSDGNPRRLIGILNDLLGGMRPQQSKVAKLDENEQAKVLTQASLQFSAYLKALPGGTAFFDGSPLDLSTLLTTIGSYFRQRLFRDSFTLDPVSSFTVDSNTDERLLELLRVAVYHGGIVYVDPPPDTLETSLKSKRFRLSYMLSPILKLPLTLHESVSLGTILEASTKLRVRKALALMRRASGFDGELPLS